MPEYLAPGVYVEEVSFRSKSIQGVPTSTTGFAGLAHYGPVQYLNGPRTSEPRLVTSYAEFERVYGGLAPFDQGLGQRLPYLAHAARAFFLNGGSRLYISRIYHALADDDAGVASADVAVPSSPNPSVARFRARWPGADGNVLVTVSAVRGGDVGIHTGTAVRVSGGADTGTILEVVTGGSPPAPDTPLTATSLRVLKRNQDGSLVFTDSTGQPSPPAVTDMLLPIQVNVTIEGANQRQDLYARLGLAADGNRAISKVLARDNPEDENCLVWFDYTFPQDPDHTSAYPIHLLLGLVGTTKLTQAYRLAGGKDGLFPGERDFQGDVADPDDITKKATGLEALAEVDDIAIVALPDAGSIQDSDLQFLVTQHLITHAQSDKYRIAVVDGPQGASMNQIRAFRGNFDTSYAALYHPWIETLDPNGPPAPGIPTPKLELPPSGFVAGIYARSDITRGVFKAPANEVVYGLTRFESNINQGRNEVLNPENINSLRFFPDRGNRVWGARTLSSDPEWLYVNVRRLFIYLEHSIDKSTQWVVFEPNNEALWRNITRTIKDFLEVQWRNGALLGETPDQAYFVLCDRSTMSQNDLDNGRLICLIGVAPVKPAEFVIFRIGQWTADARG
jgi:hypothetical protein